jgi:hypothetical protein
VRHVSRKRRDTFLGVTSSLTLMSWILTAQVLPRETAMRSAMLIRMVHRGLVTVATFPLPHSLLDRAAAP